MSADAELDCDYATAGCIRRSRGCVRGAGFLYQTGGISFNGGIVEGVDAFSSAIQGDGTLGHWNAITPLPEAVYFHASVQADGFLYVLGGDHYNDNDGDVHLQHRLLREDKSGRNDRGMEDKRTNCRNRFFLLGAAAPGSIPSTQSAALIAIS